MKHAYRGRQDQRVQIEVTAFPARILLSIYDWGESFYRDDVCAPAFDGSRDNGFGLFIIEQAMDSVDYRRDNLGRNCLMLSKDL